MILTFEENYSALLNFGLKADMDVLIFGDGTIGQGLCFFAKHLGARSVCCVGHHDEKLQKIRDIAGADLTVNAHSMSVEEALKGRMFDIVIDAVGNIDVVRQAFHFVRDNGSVCIYGVMKREDANLNLFDMKNHTSLHMLTWPYDEHRVHDDIVRLILNGKLNPADYYSHVLPMDQIDEAIRLLKCRKASKVILDMV